MPTKLLQLIAHKPSFFGMSSNGKTTSLALCVIGDEILNGKTKDTNSQYIAEKCFQIGLDLREVRIIPDVEHSITDTVTSLSSKFDIVFTSGGIGPTHDDITYATIAKAFNRRLIYLEEAANRMKYKRKIDQLNPGQVRMCTVPSPDDILYTEGLWQPTVIIKNIAIFPGVPGLFTRMVDNWMTQKVSDYCLSPKRRIGLRTELRESVVCETLGDFHQRALELGWAIGSYPKMNVEKDETWVEISLSGPALGGASQAMLEKLIDEMKSEYNAIVLH